jgi:hypothetical protein
MLRTRFGSEADGETNGRHRGQGHGSHPSTWEKDMAVDAGPRYEHQQ